MVLWLFLFFLRNIIFRIIIVDYHATFVPDYANVLVKVVAIFGLINRVHATTPAHVFCYSAVAHIQLPRKIWLSGLNRASKINIGLEPGLGLWFRARAGIRLQNEALSQLCMGMYAGANKGRFKGYVLQPPTVKIDWNHFVKQATLILGQMFFLLIRGYQWRFWYGFMQWCSVALKRFVAFSKKGNVQEKYLSSLWR